MILNVDDWWEGEESNLSTAHRQLQVAKIWHPALPDSPVKFGNTGEWKNLFCLSALTGSLAGGSPSLGSNPYSFSPKYRSRILQTISLA